MALLARIASPADDHAQTFLQKFGEVGSLFRGSITGTDNGDRLTF